MIDQPYWKLRQQMKLKGASKTEREPQEAPEKEAAGEKAQKPAKAAKSPGKKPKIKRVCKKRAKQERQYKPVRKKFLADHPVCELGYDGRSEERRVGKEC